MKLADLPPELLCYVASFASPRALACLEQVSRAWFTLLRPHDQLWHRHAVDLLRARLGLRAGTAPAEASAVKRAIGREYSSVAAGVTWRQLCHFWHSSGARQRRTGQERLLAKTAREWYHNRELAYTLRYPLSELAQWDQAEPPQGWANSWAVLEVDQVHGHIVSGGEDNEVHLWDMRGQRLQSFFQPRFSDGLVSCVLSNGEVVIAGYLDEPDRDHAVISVWDISSDGNAQGGMSSPKFTLQGHTASVFDLKFGATNSTLLSGSADATVACWDLVAGRRTGLVVMNSIVPQLEPCIAGQPHLVLAGLSDSTHIGVIDMRTLSSVHSLTSPEHPLGRFAVSECGNIVVAGEKPLNGEIGGVNAWDLRRLDRPIFRATPPHPTAECGYVEAVACARGVVVSAHESSRIYLWSLDDGTYRGEHQANYLIRHLAVDKASGHCAMGGEGGGVSCLDLAGVSDDQQPIVDTIEDQTSSTAQYSLFDVVDLKMTARGPLVAKRDGSIRFHDYAPPTLAD